jgi:ADP-ribose pyrophosphatase YjhB (NUDIX family)
MSDPPRIADNGPIGNYPFESKVPEGHERERFVCRDCGWIHYVNPHVVVGAVCTWDDRILLCRRAIEPRRGYWTMPAGFLEEGETTEQGAVREAIEEANARIEIDALLCLFSVPHLSQVQLIYRARMLDLAASPGPESTEVQLYRWDEIPWADLAFPTVRWSLLHYHEVRDKAVFAPFRGPPVTG